MFAEAKRNIVLFLDVHVMYFLIIPHPKLNCLWFQLNAITDSVDEIRALVGTMNQTTDERHQRFAENMEQLRIKNEQQDMMNEMLPVLERFCADYAQRENVRVSLRLLMY